MSMQRYAALQFARPSQTSPVNLIAASLSAPGVTIRLSTIRTAKHRADDALPGRDDMLLDAVPHLRAFAISLCRNLDRADDFVQETLLRALANINTFRPGTNLHAWLFTILRNLVWSDYRKRCREIEDTDDGYLDSLKSPPEQQGQLELEQVRLALEKLPDSQREALLLVSASGFTYETAAICETPVGTVKSRVSRARTRLSELLALDGQPDRFGPDPTTRALLTAGGRG